MRICRIRWAALPVVLALAACGGGGSGDNSSSIPISGPTPEAPAWSQRIEPYDPGKSASAAKAVSPQPSALAAPADTRAIRSIIARNGAVMRRLMTMDVSTQAALAPMMMSVKAILSNIKYLQFFFFIRRISIKTLKKMLQIYCKLYFFFYTYMLKYIVCKFFGG